MYAKASHQEPTLINVFLYDALNIDQFQWPDTEEGKKGRDYLYPLIKEGVESYLLNVSTKLLLVACNNVFLPITVNEKEYENSYVASNYYALKFYKETFSQKHPLLLKLQSPFLFLGGNFLKLFKINKTIFLNNWLMTNSLDPKISKEEWGAIMDCLKHEFPFHTIIYRHLDAFLKKDLLSSLKETHFHLLKTREIFFYEPGKKSLHNAEVRKTHRRDARLLEKHNYEIIRTDEIEEKDFSRIISLYEMIYLNKYTKYGPKYSEKFLKNTHQKKILNFVALRKNGIIEGFFGYFIFNKGMINCLFGYDVTLPHAREIYCILANLILSETEKLGVVINEGSGGEQAKLNRGLLPHTEYMGLYNAHLPFTRRLMWEGIAYIYKKLQRV